MVERNDILAAAARIRGEVATTPLIESRWDGRRFWLKAECLQHGGAFKLRGASNRLLMMDAQERARGAVAFSSGNHARGVAIAARRHGIKATIVMPADAPAMKIEGTRAEGAQIVLYDRERESREAIAADIAARTGAIVVPSFDDEAIIAGQGTVGLEITEQMGAAPSAIVVPCGGGGLAAGIALACPDSAMTIVEPEGWDDMARSLAGGAIVSVEAGPPATRCDALQTLRVSELTFSVLAARKAGAVAVSDREVEWAMRHAFDHHRLVVEPGGAVGLAALLAGRIDGGEDIVVVLSGGNVDPAEHARIVGKTA